MKQEEENMQYWSGGGRKRCCGYPQEYSCRSNNGVLRIHQGKIDEFSIRRMTRIAAPQRYSSGFFVDSASISWLHGRVVDCRALCSEHDASESLEERSNHRNNTTQCDSYKSDGLMECSLLPVLSGLVVVGGVLALPADAAIGFVDEPSNALSLPTWAVHTSSVFEWGIGMYLMWKYGQVSGNPRWKGMAWGMLPCLGSAMCACTWHFYYNSTDVQFLVALQAFLTVVGNFTCWIAAYRIYQGSQEA